MASAASRPRTRSAIMRAFRGAIRENLALALLPIRDTSRNRRRALVPAGRLSVPDEPVEPSHASVIQPDVARRDEGPLPRHRGASRGGREGELRLMRRYGLSAAPATWQGTRKSGARFLPAEARARKR